jgi:glucose-1-phosphate thymidylyltransferase
MNALILAAGYATRLYPLTKDFPKPLLEVGGHALLDYLVDQLEDLAGLERIVSVTNHRFTPHFEKWRRRRRQEARIEILDDGTTSNEDRLGAIGDLQWALQQGLDRDDLLVAAGDNLLQFSLAEFVAAYRARPTTQVCVHWVEDPERCRRTGIAVLNAEDRVIEFAEKPQEPKTHWAVPPIYVFPKATLARVSTYLDKGGSRDTPGRFIEWLCRLEPVYAFRAQGAILDIGTPQSLKSARERFAAALPCRRVGRPGRAKP